MINSKNNFDLIIGSILIFLLGFQMIEVSGAENSFRQKRAHSPQLPYFTDVSHQAGVDHPGKSISAIWLDYNEDGWLDLFVCNGYNQSNVLYRNLKNGAFENVTAKVGLVDFRWSHTAHWIDLDNDGNFELCVQNKLSTQIFRKTEQDSFINITDSFGFLSQGNLTWADFNDDGLLDVYICRSDENQQWEGSPPNLLYKNIGNDCFEEIAGKAGVAGEGDSYCANWVDFDNDGFLDLHVINGNHQPDHLYRNNGNETFTDVMNQSAIAEHDGSSYWVDFNNDGWMDLFIAEPEQGTLYKNIGGGRFNNVTQKIGIAFPPNISPPANWIDFDIDGYLDIYFLATIEIYHSKPNLYRNNGNETFTDISQDVGLDILTTAYNSVWGDYDNDGDPDLYLPSKDPNIFYRNDGNKNKWSKIHLIPSISNPSAIGARVVLISGSLRQTREVGVGQNWKSYANPLLFGLGVNTQIDSIIVRWPTGMAQDTTKIAANQPVIIHEMKPPLFSDASIESGIGLDTAKSSGAAFIDFDHDGWLDILVGQQPPVMYRNNGAGKFIEASKQAKID